MSAGNEAPRLSWRQRVCTCFVPKPKSQFSAQFRVGYLFAFSRSARGRQTTEAAPARTPTIGWSPQSLKVGSFRKSGQTVRLREAVSRSQTFTRTLSLPKRPQLAEAIVRAWPVRSPATCDSQPTSTPAKLSGFFSCTHSRPAAVWSYPRKLVTA